MDKISLAKSDLLVDEKANDASHNLLSDAIDMVKNHPVETAAAALAVAGGVYSLGKLMLSTVGKSEAGNVMRSAAEKGSLSFETHGDLGAHLHPDIVERLELNGPPLIKTARFDGNHNVEMVSREERFRIYAEPFEHKIKE